MRRLLVICLVIPLLAGCGTGAERMVAAPQPAARPVRLLVVGDSLSVGYYASDLGASYVTLLQQGLDRRGLSVSTTLIAKAGVTAVDASQWRLGIPSDDIVVELGTNDYGDSVPLSSFQAAYDTILWALRRAAPQANLYCLGTWSNPAEVNRTGATAGMYDTVIQSSCHIARGDYVDLSPFYEQTGNHGPAGAATYLGTSDWFHPNDAGHDAIAELLLQVISVGTRPDAAGPA
ncbi:MAG TPA: SGNH/GDSL hydrolase family protein [Candidatus Dormibacteraeota bacterium]|nr:SGNH/GDSL hydrolase family protein [Candidatus Dormibacteraeota bacterium]